MAAGDREQLIRLLEPVVEDLGYELVELELVNERGWVLRLYIDAPPGITVDDCATVSDQVEAVLDEADPIAVAYHLEVSSPGVERPLRRAADFERFVGEQVAIRTYAPLDGQRRFTGVLADFSDGTAVLDTQQGRAEIPLDQVAKAHLVAEFDF
jgi:ribosome maturation factor RimP